MSAIRDSKSYTQGRINGLLEAKAMIPGYYDEAVRFRNEIDQRVKEYEEVLEEKKRA